MKCNDCGKEIKETDRTCPHCGAETNSDSSDKKGVTLLVQRAMQKDDSAWEEIYAKTHRYVYFMALKFLHTKEDAQDITQEVYIQAMRSIDQLNSAESFMGWLRSIIYSKCKDLVKRKQPVLLDDDEDGGSPLDDIPELDEEFLPERVLDNSETRRMVLELVNALPYLQRQSVMFYYYDEMPVERIAELMECASGTIKSRLNYARQQIRKGVEEHERKGVKLYSMSAIPILTILLREEARSLLIPPSVAGGIAAILAQIAGSGAGVGVAGEVAAQASGTAAQASGTAAQSAGTVAQASGAAAQTAASVTAQTAASATVKASTPLITKIIAGVLAGGLVVGGGVMLLTNNDTDDEAPHLSVSAPADDLEPAISNIDNADGRTDGEMDLQGARLRSDEWVINGISLLEPNIRAFQQSFGGELDLDYNVGTLDNPEPSIGLEANWEWGLAQGYGGIVPYGGYQLHRTNQLIQVWTMIDGHTGPRGIEVGKTTGQEILDTIPDIDSLYLYNFPDGNSSRSHDFAGSALQDSTQRYWEYITIFYDDTNIYGNDNPKGQPNSIEFSDVINGQQHRYYISFQNGIVSRLDFSLNYREGENTGETPAEESYYNTLSGEQKHLLSRLEAALQALDYQSAYAIQRTPEFHAIIDNIPYASIDYDSFTYCPNDEIMVIVHRARDIYRSYSMTVFNGKDGNGEFFLGSHQVDEYYEYCLNHAYYSGGKANGPFTYYYYTPAFGGLEHGTNRGNLKDGEPYGPVYGEVLGAQSEMNDYPPEWFNWWPEWPER